MDANTANMTPIQQSPGPHWSKLLIGLVVIVVIVFGYGTLAKHYGWWPHEKNVSVDTSTWQTYRNDEYGFEFKYPNDYSIDEIAPDKDVAVPFYFEVSAADKISHTGFDVSLSLQQEGDAADCLKGDLLKEEIDTFGGKEVFGVSCSGEKGAYYNFTKDNFQFFIEYTPQNDNALHVLETFKFTN